MRRVTLGVLLVAGAVVFAPSLASAEDNPRRAQAEVLLKEGKQLHDADKEEEALAHYRRAYELYPTSNILFAIAASEQILGRSVEAIRHYREALKSRTLHPNNVERGQEYVRDLEAKLGRLEVKAPAGTTLTIDGAPFEGSLDEPIDLEPGDHAIEATWGDKRARQSVACAAGETSSVTLTFEDAAEKTPLTEPPKEPAPSSSSSLFSTRNVVGGSAAVLGLAAAAAGVAFLIDSNERADRGRSIVDRAPGACDQRVAACANYRDQLYEDANSSRDISYVGFAVSGALLVGAVAVFALWPSPEGNTRGALRATLARSFVGLGADF